MRKPDGRWVVEAADLGMELPVMIHRAQLHELITAEFGPGGHGPDRVRRTHGEAGRGRGHGQR